MTPASLPYANEVQLMVQDAWSGDNAPLWRGYECRDCRYQSDCLLPHQECQRRRRMAAIVEMANESQEAGLYE